MQCRQLTLWKNENLTLTEIFFRQINFLVIYLVSFAFNKMKFLAEKNYVELVTLCNAASNPI